MQLLLESGLNASEGGCSHAPLVQAAAKGHDSIVEVLLNYHADIDEAELGTTPLLKAAEGATKVLCGFCCDVELTSIYMMAPRA